MDFNKLKGSLLLTLTAIIWGSAFVAQSVGMDYIEPFTFLCIRSVLGGIVLLPLIFIRKDKKRRNGNPEPLLNKTLIRGGIICGVILFVSSAFQQVGLTGTTAGKTAFITALYIVIVPLLGIFTGKKVNFLMWVGVIIAAVGMYLLCIDGSFTIMNGDILILVCAFCFSFHIIAVDRFSPLVDGIKLSCIQFFVSGILAAVPMLIFENPQTDNIVKCAMPLLYTGILSSGVAYTLQIIGQKYVNMTVASLIMSLEAVFAGIFGWLILHETMTYKELSGCVLIITAIVLAQFAPVLSRKKN